MIESSKDLDKLLARAAHRVISTNQDLGSTIADMVCELIFNTDAWINNPTVYNNFRKHMISHCENYVKQAKRQVIEH